MNDNDNEYENKKKEDEKKDILITNPDLNDIDKERVPSCSVYWILSMICWSLFLFTGYCAVIQIIIFRNYNYSISIIWSILKFENSYQRTFYTLTTMDRNIILALFIIILIFATSEFIFLIKSYKRDYDIYNILMGKKAKFHFIPLLFVICFFVVGIYFNTKIKYLSNDEKIEYSLSKYPFSVIIYGIVLSILILILLFIFYFLIKIEKETFLKFLLIKGTFSCLISLSNYTLFNNIEFCIWQKLRKDNELNLLTFLIIIFIRSFQLIPGLFNIILSIKYKDYIFAAMNFIIYLGMNLEFLSFYSERNIIGLYLNIIMMILSVASVFVVYKRRNNNYIGQINPIV